MCADDDGFVGSEKLAQWWLQNYACLDRFVQQLMPAGTDHESLLQDVFLKLFGRLLSGYRIRQETLKPFVLTALRNAVIDYKRRRGPVRTQQIPHGCEPGAPNGGWPVNDDAAESQMEDQLKQAIEAAVQSLSLYERRVALVWLETGGDRAGGLVRLGIDQADKNAPQRQYDQPLHNLKKKLQRLLSVQAAGLADRLGIAFAKQWLLQALQRGLNDVHS